MLDYSNQQRKRYKLNTLVTCIDHNGQIAIFEAGDIFWWNHLRFICFETGQEISRAKLRAAGGMMIPVDMTGSTINLSEAGPLEEELIPEPSRKFAITV